MIQVAITRGMIVRASIVFLILVVTGTSAFSQCSDAGVCAIGNDEPESQFSLSADLVYGKSKPEDDIRYSSLRIAANLRLSEALGISATLPYNRQTGPLGTVNGVGDLTLLLIQGLTEKPGSRLSLQAGVRVATADVNAGGLPQRYQSGLGTTDILLGMEYSAGSLTVAAGYQVSRGRSANSVDRLKRGDDVMLRGGYRMDAGALAIHGEVVLVKRLGLSSVRDTSVAGQETFVDLPGSDQLQINLIARPTYQISRILVIEAYVAVPLLNRKVNVDGLTRVLTLGAGIKILL